MKQLPTTGTPSLVFGFRCALMRTQALTRAQSEAWYEIGAEEVDESPRLVFALESSFVGKMERSLANATTEDCARGRFTPCTRRCFALWLALHLRQKIEGIGCREGALPQCEQ